MRTRVNFCDQHRDILLDDLRVRGLSSLCILDDDDRALVQIADVVYNGASIDNFDPYGLARSLIFHAVMNLFGHNAIELMVTPDLGLEQCPVCFIDQHCPSTCKDHLRFIHWAADRQLEDWRQLTASD